MEPRRVGLGSGDISSSRNRKVGQGDTFLYRISVFRSRPRKGGIILLALLLMVATISLGMSIIEKDQSGIGFGIFIVAVAMLVAYRTLISRKIVLGDRKIEYWARGRKWFEADWEEVTRVMCYWAYERTPALTIKSKDDSLSLTIALGFEESALKEIFRAIVDLPREYYEMEIKDELGWGDAGK